MSLAVITFNSRMGTVWTARDGVWFYHCNVPDSKDDGRIWRAEYADQEMVRKQQQDMRLDRVHVVEVQQAAEGVTYGA